MCWMVQCQLWCSRVKWIGRIGIGVRMPGRLRRGGLLGRPMRASFYFVD